MIVKVLSVDPETQRKAFLHISEEYMEDRDGSCSSDGVYTKRNYYIFATFRREGAVLVSVSTVLDTGAGPDQI